MSNPLDSTVAELRATGCLTETEIRVIMELRELLTHHRQQMLIIRTDGRIIQLLLAAPAIRLQI